MKKVLRKLSKPKAHYHIEIWTEDPEEWFLEVSKCKKNGEIHSSDTIIKKDLNDRISHLQNLGWVEEN